MAGSGENHSSRPSVGLNSGGEGLRLTDFKLSLRGMQGVTERNSLNWLFGICWAVILCLGGFRQYLWGVDQPAFFCVDSPGS